MSDDKEITGMIIPVGAVREAVEFWLYTYVFKDNVKVKDMTFKTDGQVQITFEHLGGKPK